MSAVLVLNLGMKSIRSIIFTGEGRKLASASLPLQSGINDRRVEQDANEWWEKAIEVMRRSIKDADVKCLDAITVTASASCLICAGSDGEPLLPVMMVSDKRAAKEAEEIADTLAFKKVNEATGLSMSVSLMLPKILWVKKHRPKIFEQTAYFFTPNDYLVFRLCGSPATDSLNAGKYHYFDGYPAELLDAFKIPVSKLPKVVAVGTNVGNIHSKLAHTLGLNKDVNIIVTSYDAICSFWGSGVANEGEASDVSGTVTVFRCLSYLENPTPPPSGRFRVYVTPFETENARIVGGSNNLGGGLIEWLKQCCYQNETYPYEVMEKEAAESEIGARGLIFLPYLLGERAPIWNDDARGVFFGLERMHTRKDMARAVFESAGFIDMDMTEAILETGIKVKSVRLSGGLSRIGLISQIKADILGKDTIVLSEFETTSAGAAMLALKGIGKFSSVKEAAKNFVKTRMIIKPDMENHQKYKYLHNLYKSTYEILKPQYQRRIKILDYIRSDREVKIENL